MIPLVFSIAPFTALPASQQQPVINKALVNPRYDGLNLSALLPPSLQASPQKRIPQLPLYLSQPPRPPHPCWHNPHRHQTNISLHPYSSRILAQQSTYTMKPFHSHLLIPLTLWSSNLKRASGQNYLSTCKDCSLQQIKYLSCSCLTGLNGTLVNTTLDTDTCIGNDQWGNLFHGG